MKRPLFLLVFVAVLLALSACTAPQTAEPAAPVEQGQATIATPPTDPLPTAAQVPTPLPTPIPTPFPNRTNW